MIEIPAVALATKIKLAVTAAVAVSLVSACMLRDASLRNEGEARVVARSKEQGKINAKKADQAHERARAPGAADRLRKSDCRDC